MLAFGIDAVEISRFESWHLVPGRYKRIFSDDEIAYCMSVPIRSAERFAARFAAREAFFKALCSYFPHNKIPFLTVCRAVRVSLKTSGVPLLEVDWVLLSQRSCVTVPKLLPRVLMSISHTKNIATACVGFTFEPVRL